MSIYPVILAGGNGTRLWPLSRGNYPKQYLSPTGEHSLLQQTAMRAAQLPDAVSPIVIANNEQRFLVTEQLRQAGIAPLYDYTHVTEGLPTGDVAKGHWHEGGVMADYALSKCTDVYAEAFYQRATGAAGPAWIVGTTGASSGNHQVAGRVGIRHKF
ncbi:hypothetical protein E9536_39365 [Burkholderia sp. LS-044]|nr:hypothetical protein E9536_39365 [Burkholderia sp. LS-044]